MERRTQTRHAVRLEAQLVWNNGKGRHPCIIRDLSIDGARVDTGSYVALPPSVFLLEPSSENVFECLVRWQQGGEIGLYLIDIGNRTTRRALIQKYSEPVS